MKLKLITLGAVLLSLGACAGDHRDAYAWMWKHRKASADELRTVARSLADPQLSDEAVLDKWAAFSESFGLSVFRPSYLAWVAAGGGPERFWIPGSLYSIDEDDVTSAGWRLRCPLADEQTVLERGAFEPIDAEGVFISASQPSVWFVGRRSVSQQPPGPDELKQTTLAISSGNGRLILVDLSGEHGVEVLPYGVK